MARKLLKIVLNGDPVEVSIQPSALLLDVLRDQLGLTGAKQACGEGECGACTVLLDGKAVNSCITPAMKAMNKEVLTIEGLDDGGKLHPIQQAFIDHGAIQCGFCTPGMVLATKALLDQNPNPSEVEVKIGLSGNLCRCTGYIKIIEAVLAVAKKMHDS